MNIATLVSNGRILKVGLETYGIKSRPDKSTCMYKVWFILHNIDVAMCGDSIKQQCKKKVKRGRCISLLYTVYR